MEAGTHSIWISEQLEEMGHDVIVANVRELRALYAAMEGLAGQAAWDRQEAWARAWMSDRFDQARLAAEREAITERGRQQQ